MRNKRWSFTYLLNYTLVSFLALCTKKRAKDEQSVSRCSGAGREGSLFGIEGSTLLFFNFLINYPHIFDAMSCHDEVLKIGKKLEKMISSKSTVICEICIFWYDQDLLPVDGGRYVITAGKHRNYFENRACILGPRWHCFPGKNWLTNIFRFCSD